MARPPVPGRKTRRRSPDPRGGKDHRFGFVACLGRTNVGKSTLVNMLLGQKLGIVSRKPQTTRLRVRGILNLEAAQVVLVDTPGLPSTRNPVNESLEQEARRSVESADAVMAVTDPEGKRKTEEEERMIEIVRRAGRPSVLALNKSDLVGPQARRELLERYKSLGLFRSTIAVSAKTGENLQLISETLAEAVPPGPPLFPGDILSDQQERDFFAEIVREKIFRNLHQELPYSAAVVLDEVKEDPERRLCRVSATIYVERESQKGILIGEGGGALKRIGTAARRDMENLTGTRVYLSLWVKVRRNWTRDPHSLREFGFGQDAG